MHDIYQFPQFPGVEISMALSDLAPEQLKAAKRRLEILRLAAECQANHPDVSQNLLAVRIGVPVATLVRLRRAHWLGGFRGLVPGKSTGRPRKLRS